MKIGIISLGGPSSKQIAEECKKHFDVVDEIDIRNIEVHTENLSVLYEGKPLPSYDCVYVRGSYRYSLLQRTITRALKDSCYIPTSPESFEICHNKFSTLVELQKNNIPIPSTYLVRSVDGAKQLLDKIRYPIIMKILSGTQGKGVMIADSIESARSVLDAIDVLKQPYIIQEYIETNATDIRALVIGDKVVAAMKRQGDSKKDMRSNLHSGGKGIKIDLDYETESIAIRSAKAVGTEICGVDILEGTKPLVIEINLSPGLKISEVTKIDVASKIAKYLHKKTKDFIKQKKEVDYKDVMKELEVKSVDDGPQQLINLDIKSQIIRLPPEVAKITEFKPDEEVVLLAKKGRLTIKKLDLEKD